MDIQHKELAAGRWQDLSLAAQLANVGSEVIRSIKWQGRNEEFSRKAADRALELMSLTLFDSKHQGRRRELNRLYEVVVNDLYGFPDYRVDLKRLEAYFMAFAYAASMERRARD